MTWAVGTIPDAWPALAGMPDLQTDVIITDPPYPKAVQENMCSGSLVGTKSVPKYDLPFDPLTAEQTRMIATHFPRLAKRWALVFCSLESFGQFQAFNPAAYVRGGVWYKSNATGQLTADRPATAFEGIAWLHGPRDAGHEKKRWNGKGSYGIWRCNGTRGVKGRHPNEKPLDLCLKLVALASERGETVLDPFCGSGAIGHACVLLGRHYIGLDNDPIWSERARVRLKAVESHWGEVSDQTALQLCSMRGDDPPDTEAA